MRPIWGATAIALGVSITVAAAGHTRAIVIGIRDYTSDALTKPVPFADNDARLFEKYVGRTFDQTPVLLNTPQATLLHSVKYALNSVLAQAATGDTICIFLSSRGIARPGGDGYIGTSDMSASKPESTGLPLAFLRQTIKDSDADRVIVFADVCRRPAESFANHINIRLGELGAILKPAVAGILASEPGKLSEEKDQMAFRAEPPAGYGVFGYFLADSGSTGKPNLADLYSTLAKRVPSATKTEQKPREFGNDRAKSAPLRAAVVFEDEGRPGFPKYPALLASRFWLAGLLAMQANAGVSRLQAIRTEVVSGARDPVSLATEIVNLERDTPAAEWAPVRDLALISFANEGQKFVDRYGMQDLLPGDPERVTEAEFARGAVLFEAAHKLVSGPRFKGFANGLLVRQKLCEGRPGKQNGFVLLNEADAIKDARIPEVNNSLGIFYLEGQQKDYYKAIEEFKKAKKFSPGWMYPRHNLALTYIERGEYASAEQEYREAITVDRLQPALYYNLGLLYHRLNRRSEADATYKKAIEIYGATLTELQARADEWKGRTELKREVENLDKRIRVFERNRAQVLNAWGALVALRSADDARQKYEEALKADPKLCAARDNMAQLVTDQRKRRDLFIENMKLCPDFWPSTLKLARMELRSFQTAEARPLFEDVIKRAPGNKEAMSGLAVISAGGSLMQAIAAKPPGSATQSQYVELAEIYRNAGDNAGCEEAYSLAINGLEPKLSKRELHRRAKHCRN